MTRSTAPDRTPGTFLLKVARIVFDEAVCADVIEPTIADLRQEVAAAYAPKDRLVARVRGYAAFWRLVALAPIAFIGWRPSPSAAYTSPAIGIAAGMLLVLAFTPASLRGWLLVSIIGGTIVAVVIHAWYARHPTCEVVPEGRSGIGSSSWRPRAAHSPARCSSAGTRSTRRGVCRRST
jgi:hypothetical protein